MPSLQPNQRRLNPLLAHAFTAALLGLLLACVMWWLQDVTSSEAGTALLSALVSLLSRLVGKGE